jgi:hypothetical protein
MVMIEAIVLGVVLGAVVSFGVDRLIDRSSRIIDLKNEVDRLRHTLNTIKTEVDSLPKKSTTNLRVGTIFYYPEGQNFKDELVGRRAKIIGISCDGRTSIKLIDEKGVFIDDKVWNGSVHDTKYFIFESNGGLPFNFS